MIQDKMLTSLQGLAVATKFSKWRERAPSPRRLRDGFLCRPRRRARLLTWPEQVKKRKEDVQFFKESRVEGAVYHLYLKKVRYHTPSDEVGSNCDYINRTSTWYCATPPSDFEDKRLSLLQWRTVEFAVIKAGTLPRLIEALSSESGELDSTYVNVFLSTYRAFSNGADVLHGILERYHQLGEDPHMKQQAKEGHRKTLRSVLSVWIDSYPEDFHDPPSYPLLWKLIAFAEQHMEGSDLAARAQHKVDKFRREDERPSPLVEDVQLQLSHLRLVPVPKNASSVLPRPVEFEDIPPRLLAEQLTYIEAELFKKVLPHHCLGSVWSRDKKRLRAPSVYATVNQFNAVSYRVIATVLKHLDLEPQERAHVLEKWISVAQELRLLKNFSSLKAILSGLQSNCVYRLKKVWTEVSSENLLLYQELADIFSEDNNQMVARELLMKEGTAKFADLDNTSLIRGHPRRRSGTLPNRKQRLQSQPDAENNQNTVQGTVPYLGTFLTDLTMIDVAIPDTTEDGLINMDKRRKEFEILAQIRLLQSAAQLYTLSPDPGFLEWFHSIRVYDDKESYELSCEIESVTPTTPTGMRKHRKNSSLGFFTPRRPSMSVEDLTVSSPTICSDQASLNSFNMDSPDSNMPTLRAGLRHSISAGSLLSTDSDISVSPWRSPETCVVKVTMETTDSHHTNMYKSVMLTNSDHTKAVIRNILQKFHIEANPQEYVIFQQIGEDTEMQIPDKGNVFYAINNNVPEVKFLVRKRLDWERLKLKQKKKHKQKTKVSL